ncbi:hypothetical protein CYMTET_13998 [Cymbomonas tetramitiformis]|uniref:Uncharacterized protein n=1 Tax=Cymbomonas tetramitiformis TaxID=36881 RepID=A0AAE0C379_9CHLO|nr:hypothetical protein CYMTET_43764 [Cymbomonas tetramitiformis]KAK3278034.1 hypothetical protein CYMTET_13998 [Cymbomonas tetramitiformis]
MLCIVKGVLKAIFLSNPPVSDGHSGVNIAKNLLGGIKPFNISNEMFQQQFTGHSYDGQYFSLNVPEELCILVGSSVEWTLPGWGGAHRLELVLGDTRKDKEGSVPLPTVAWYGNIPTIVSSQLAKVSYGKGYEEIRKIAAELQERLYNPARFCDTRFAQAERKVYLNFLRDWHIFQVRLQRRCEEFPGDGETKDLLKQLKEFEFVGLLMGLTDLLEHTQFLSLQLQTVNKLPWEQRQHMLEFETLFKFLLEELRATAHGAQRFPLHNMPYFADKLEEFKKGEFAGTGVRWFCTFSKLAW